MKTTSTIPPDTPAIALAPWVVAQTILAEAGLDGETILLGAGAERIGETVARQRLIYVVAGSITATLAPTNHILTADATLVVPANRPLVVRNHTGDPAKVLLLTLPAPRVEWRAIFPETARE